MKEIILCFLLQCFAFQIVHGQTWLPLGEGVRPEHSFQSADVESMAFDSVNQLLYVGGDFYFAGDTVSRMLAVWDGNDWFTVETGGYLADPVKALIMHNDTAYRASGGIISTYYKGQLQVESGLNGIGGKIYCMQFYHDTLYAGGILEAILKNGLERNGKHLVEG